MKNEIWEEYSSYEIDSEGSCIVRLKAQVFMSPTMEIANQSRHKK